MESNDLDIENMILQRNRLRKKRLFADADKLRMEIETNFQVLLEDKADGTTEWVTQHGMEDRRKRKREQAAEAKTNQRRKQYNGIDLKVLENIPRSRQLRNRTRHKHVKAQKERFYHFSKFVELNFLNDVYRSKLNATCLDICGGNGSLSWELLKPEEYNPDKRRSPSDVRQRLKCVIVDPKSVQFSHRKSKLLWNLYNIHASNGKESGSINTDDTPEAQVQTQEHKVPKQLHPRIQNMLDGAQLQEVNKYLYERIGFQQIHDNFDKQFLQKYWDIWTAADFVLALHPDQATDDVVFMCMENFKAFACVPCCVFPSMFSHRKLKCGKQVRLHGELVQYLMEKADVVNSKKKIKICKMNGKAANTQMVYIVKQYRIESMPGPCNIAIYGKYYPIVNKQAVS